MGSLLLFYAEPQKQAIHVHSVSGFQNTSHYWFSCEMLIVGLNLWLNREKQYVTHMYVRKDVCANVYYVHYGP